MTIQVPNVDAASPENRSTSSVARQNEASVLQMMSVKRNIEEKKAELPDEKQIKSVLEQAEKMASIFDRNLKFLYRKEADVYQVEVIDASKNEVVRKIPPDEMIRFIEHINEMLGALFDMNA